MTRIMPKRSAPFTGRLNKLSEIENRQTEGHTHIGISSPKTDLFAHNFFKNSRYATAYREFCSLFCIKNLSFSDAQQFCTRKNQHAAKMKNEAMLTHSKAFQRVRGQFFPCKTCFSLCECAQRSADFKFSVPLFRLPRQINPRQLIPEGREYLFQQLCGGETQGAGIAAGMAGKPFR